MFAGYRLGAQIESAPILSEAFVKQVLHLCTSAGIEISEEEVQLVHEWIGGS